MTITNKQGLPTALVRVAERHTHRSADFSVTELEKSARQLWLQRRHDHEIETDISQMIYSIMGTAVHKLLEDGEGEHEFSETYMTQEVYGHTVSGTADLYDFETHTISDWKNTSVWSIIYDSRREDWTKQLNVYAWMFRKMGFQVDHAKIVAILRDWSATKAKFDPSYPQMQTIVVDIKLWTDEQVEKYVTERVEALSKHEDTPDDKLPHCTDEERWKDPDKFAVMKEGRKSAVKLHDNPFEAQKHAQELGPKHYVGHRPSEPRRCENYCAAAAFCNQYQEELRAKSIG